VGLIGAPWARLEPAVDPVLGRTREPTRGRMTAACG
jgi:hypothetical protein